MTTVISKTHILHHGGRPLRLHYLTNSTPPSPSTITILLIHGFPQTSHQFVRVLPLLGNYHCIAVDYPGAGLSSCGTDHKKSTMASLLHELMLSLSASKVVVVGHDIGGMIAHAYAMRYPVLGIIWGECPLPGTRAFERRTTYEGLRTRFHFCLHAQVDLAVSLLQGREALYIRSFLDSQSVIPLKETDIQEYIRAYSRPGALRSACETYAALPSDATENIAWLKEHGKSDVPCLILSGEFFDHQDDALDMAQEHYRGVQHKILPGVGHYLAEEDCYAFAHQIKTFTSSLAESKGQL